MAAFREKPVVEDARTLSISEMIKEGAIVPGESREGVIACGRKGEDKPYAIIRFVSDLSHADPALHILVLSFCVNGAPVQQALTFDTPRMHHGGKRYWFRCPITQKKAGKLQLPLGARKFASREGHGLTYLSCRESGPFRSLARQFGFTSTKQLERAMNGQ